MAPGRRGGGTAQLRPRAETRRRKWRAGAGDASTLRGGGDRCGKCRSRRRGEEGGDGDGPGEGETLCLAGATRAGLTLLGDIPALKWTCPPGPSPCLGPRPPSPQRILTQFIFGRDGGHGWLPFIKNGNLPARFLGRSICSSSPPVRPAAG